MTLDWKSLLGIPFTLPFCSAVVAVSSGTIYVSGSVGAQRGPDGKPMIVPGQRKAVVAPPEIPGGSEGSLLVG